MFTYHLCFNCHSLLSNLFFIICKVPKTALKSIGTIYLLAYVYTLFCHTLFIQTNAIFFCHSFEIGILFHLQFIQRSISFSCQFFSLFSSIFSGSYLILSFCCWFCFIWRSFSQTCLPLGFHCVWKLKVWGFIPVIHGGQDMKGISGI